MSTITPISPLDIPACVLWVTPDTLQPSTSGNAAGSPLTDVTGLNTLTQATSGNQPTVAFPKLGGAAAFQWNGTSQYYDLGNASSGNLFNLQSGSYSFAFAFNTGSSVSNYCTFLSKTTSGNSRFFFLINSLKFYRFNALSSQTLQANTPYVFIYTYQYLTATTGNEYLYANGKLVASNLNVTMSNDTTNSFQIGAAHSNYYLSQDTYHICAWKGVLSNSQMLGISNYFLKKMGVILNLVMNGNSLVYGVGASIPAFGHGNLIKNLVNANIFNNFGLSGNRFINSAAPASGVGLITRMFDVNILNTTGEYDCSMPAVDFNILVAWEATNAFWRDNVSVQANINDTLSYFSLAKKMGYQLGTCTAPYMTAAAETKRLAYNAWMRSNWGSFADFLVDYGGDALLNNADNTGVSTYSPWFGAGGVHPNNLGHARMANIAARDIINFMQRKSAIRN